MSRIVVELYFVGFILTSTRGRSFLYEVEVAGRRLVAALLGLGSLAVHRKEPWRAGCLARQDAWAAGPGDACRLACRTQSQEDYSSRMELRGSQLD